MLMHHMLSRLDERHQVKVTEAIHFVADSKTKFNKMAGTVKDLVSRIKMEVPKENSFLLGEGKRDMFTR